MWLVYNRERKYIGTKWLRVTYFTLPLAAAQSLGSQVLEDSQSCSLEPNDSDRKQAIVSRPKISNFGM
jgi:hypothetical protein